MIESIIFSNIVMAHFLFPLEGPYMIYWSLLWLEEPKYLDSIATMLFAGAVVLTFNWWLGSIMRFAYDKYVNKSKNSNARALKVEKKFSNNAIWFFLATIFPFGMAITSLAGFCRFSLAKTIIYTVSLHIIWYLVKYSLFNY